MRILYDLDMLLRQPQPETASIELSETSSKGNEHIALKQDVLHGAEPGDATQRKRMIAGKHSLATGGGKDRTLKQLCQPPDCGAGIANTRAEKNRRLAARSNLPPGAFCFLSGSGMGDGSRLCCRFGKTDAHRSMKEIVRDLNESGARQRATKYLHGLGDGLNKCVRAGHAAGKTGKRPDDLHLLRGFMQSAARLCKQ